ncbi:Hypothetical predicted protein [Mytilus galloprovincialis]|uniref:K Homology domain-containing protein n=1 Tax=Mytilus galloprovincialis TaxID=29158 RepID=A0A8B6BIV3_MYTGA|nr:Hypothetical predicted protein [Mytilus galloprovincialis]
MGLASGRDGANIKKSRNITGVRSVRIKKKADGYRFTVIGESYKAANEARCLLEFKQKAYTVPQFLAGKLVGKHGHEIREVEDKSLVKNITKDNEKEIACTNKRSQKCNDFNADKMNLLSNSGEGNSFKGKYNVHRRKKRGKKISVSKTLYENFLVFFLENKTFRRIDYDKKQKQKQRALQKLSRYDVKIQHQDQRKLSKRERAIDFQLHSCDIIHSVPSFKEKKQCQYQQKGSKKKMIKTDVKSYVIETAHGLINLTKARYHDNCLGKYIEAAIKNRGLDGALKVASWTDCDKDRRTRIRLKFPKILNEKGEISTKNCRNNKSNIGDKQKFLAPKQKKQKAKVNKNPIETNHRKTKPTNARCRGKNIEAAIQTKGWNRTLMVGTSLDGEDYRGSYISWDSPMNSNEKGDMCFEKCIENEGKRDDEQFWLEPQQTKDTWEEWDSDEESSISAELDNFRISETNERSDCLSGSLTY